MTNMKRLRLFNQMPNTGQNQLELWAGAMSDSNTHPVATMAYYPDHRQNKYAESILVACNAYSDLIDALKRIRATSIKDTFHGDAERFQAWLDAFTSDAIAKAQ